MKIKSKLIATIVSMCAALAVMAVGVWAAATNFTLTISNNVNLQFEAAEIVIKGQATATGLTTPAELTVAETTLFENGVYVGTKPSTESAATGTNAAAFKTAVEGFQVTNDTLASLDTAATITYTYTITPTATSSYQDDITIAITENSAPSALVNGSDIFTITYTYTAYKGAAVVGTENTAFIKTGVAVDIDLAGDDQTAGTIDKVVVTCKLVYAGTTAAINVDTPWAYTIAVANAA